MPFIFRKKAKVVKYKYRRMFLRMVLMKKKQIFAGLTLAAVALLAAGCSTAKSGEGAKPVQARSSKTTKKYKEVDQNKAKTSKPKTKGVKDNSTADNNTDQDNAKQDSDAKTNQQSSADSLNAKIAQDVVKRLGYPSNFDQSDFLFSETDGVITVSENHNSAHMKAENADPNVAPAVAHYQVVGGQLYYLNFDGTKSAVQ